VVMVELCAREMGAREGGWAKTRNRAILARFRVRRAKRRRGTVRRGCATARMRWWWWWGDAFAKRNARSGWAKKPETKLPWLGFGLQWDCMRWRGVPWGYSPPPVPKTKRWDGGEVVWWVVVVCAYLLPGAPHASPYLLYPPLSTHSYPS
jgi:hypothetical protein